MRDSTALLSFADLESLSGDLFLGELDNSVLIGFLLNIFFLEGGEKLDVARGRAEWSDSTVGSVGSSSAFLSLVDLGVSNNQFVGIEALNLHHIN